MGRLGLKFQTLTPEWARRFDLVGKQGMVITEVDPGSLGSMAGLQEGLLLLVQRRDTRIFVVLKQAG